MNAPHEKRKGTYLFVVPWDITHPGGVNQVVINLYREFERSGPLQPMILVLDWHSTIPKEEVSVGCRTVRLRVRQPAGNSITVRGLISYLVKLPQTIRALNRLIAQYDVRIVNAQYPTLAFLSFVILKKLGQFKGPLLVSYHGMDVRNANETVGLVKAFWRWLVHGADAQIACSESLVKEIRILAPRSARPLIKVHNGVDPQALLEEKLPASAITRRLPQQRSILNVATFEYKKGQDVLIKAFERIAKDIPDVDLVILGGDGPERDQIRALVVAAGLERRVICFMDVPHAEVLTYMEKATVFAFPSRYEPLGIAMLEAGVFGVPVVASRVDGIPEVINSEEVGILVQAENVNSLELALRKLLTSEELRVALGGQLRKRVLAEFTWQEAWQKYVALLNDHAMPAWDSESRVSVRQ